MTPARIWFERTFEFNIPLELLPNLEARLRGAPPRLEDVLRGRSQETLIAKPDGKWSAQEHAGHLLDLEPLWLARVEDYASSAGHLTPADLTNRKTDDAHHNEQPLDEILAGFRESRSALLRRIDELSPPTFERVLRHPRMKTPMRLIDHLYFVAEHDDHHLARIWDLISGS